MDFNDKRGGFYIFKIFTNHQILLCNFIFFFFDLPSSMACEQN